jgi:hypothetical protein
MNAPHDYKPALRSADLPAIDTRCPQKPRVLLALVGVAGKGFMALQHAARGHNFAFIESGRLSRWWFKRGAMSADILADLVTASDARGKRWRIVHVISGEIRAEG